MIRTELANYLKTCNSLYPTKIMKQHWKNQIYSYTTPRPHCGFIFVTDGKIKITDKNGSFNAKTGDIIFLPKFSVYSAIFENGTDDCLIDFDSESLNFPAETPFVFLQGAPVNCQDACILLIDGYLSGVSELKIKSLFYSMLDTVVNAFSTQKEKHGTINYAKTLLKNDDELKMVEIAKLCNISESGLRKKFKDEVGISPSEFRLKFKIDSAKYLLESTDMTISEISESLHFYDSAYFCRIFKRYTGLSPKEFQKSKQL